MIFSQIHAMWRRWPSWSWIPVVLFLVILIHGSLIGLTDDEAYYWVLAQKPALGYAYHPPAVAWWIAASQWLLSPFFGKHSEIILRFPAALTCAGFLALALRWMERAGIRSENVWRAALLLLSVAGLFSLSWMMVPDIPMFFAWTLAFVATWEICFYSEERALNYLWLGIGLGLGMLSKFSAVLAAFSVVVSVLLWAPRKRWLPSIGTVVLAGIGAAVPILIWNWNHQWASILYQIRDRHGGAALSWVRYLRFWAIELLIVGPVLVSFSWILLREAKRGERVFRFVLAWLLPGAAVFLVQPLFSDFKPHWALIVWWPLALAMAWAWAGEPSRLARRAAVQIGYGWILGGLVLVSCHLPLGGLVLKTSDPRFDVTNDLYGWGELRSFLLSTAGGEALRWPVVGSRYQTASQAAFAIGEGGVGLLLPRGIGDRDEWPSSSATENVGPDWPRLKTPVFFVADNRYSEGPQFPGAQCIPLGSISKKRWELPAKLIMVWRCAPGVEQL